jgi:4-amino-4-deoxy-L-arabinose transferase-like glycosyltransferase
MTLSSKQSLFLRILPWLIIAFGIILRLDQYLFNRSLWLDEAFFANNIVDRTFGELFIPPLEYSSHIMPPGFLVMAKLMITLFGNSDLSLRLFPLVCGVISLVLFYQVAKIYISAQAVPLALFFFAISDSLIFYSSEFKQYSNDVMVALVLLMLVDYLRTSPLTLRKLLLLAIVGSLALWFSYPAVFILATIGIYLLFVHFSTTTWKPTINLALVYAIWLLNFLVLYLFIISVEAPTNQWMQQFWTLENAFMPSPLSIHGIHWLAESFFKMFNYPIGFDHAGLAGILFILGSVVLFTENRLTLLLLCLPLLLALGVSFFHQYPFSGRLLLFLTPSLYLLVAEGLTKMRIAIPTRYPTAILATGMMTVAGIFLTSGLILDSVSRTRLEYKRLVYIGYLAPQNLS